MRTYTPEHVDTVLSVRKLSGASIRGISDLLSIPKSVIGRWIKDPEVWKEKYLFNIPEGFNMSEKDIESLKKFEAKVANREDPTDYEGLEIRFEDGEWEAYS